MGVYTFDQVLKGRIAEAIIEALFVESGCCIWRTGKEWDQNQPDGSPDFRIHRPDHGIEDLEIKYREDGQVWQQDLQALRSRLRPPTLILVRLADRINSAFPDDHCRIRVVKAPYKEHDSGLLYSVPLRRLAEEWGLKIDQIATCESLVDKLFRPLKEFVV